MLNISRFMLVEDNAGEILLVQQALIKANIFNPLLVVRSGEEAIQYLSGEGVFANRNEFPLPSVLLLDLKLTGRYGLDVLEWIRCYSALRKLHVIVLASSDSIYDIDRACKLGANSFLIKPVRFERLVETMLTTHGCWLWHDTAPPAFLLEPETALKSRPTNQLAIPRVSKSTLMPPPELTARARTRHKTQPAEV
jgi:CheY-like chemotaxis protein